MLSPQSKYALRAMIYLSRCPDESYVKVEQIAKDTDLPAAYLSKILNALTESGLIISRRGKNGGVKFNRDRSPVSFHDVCHSVDDPIVQSECMLFKKHCDNSSPCAFHHKWSKTKERFLEFLHSTPV